MDDDDISFEYLIHSINIFVTNENKDINLKFRYVIYLSWKVHLSIRINSIC